MTAVRTAGVSVLVGVTVLVFKLGAWRVTGSVALFSDALESTVNVVAALALLWAVRVAARPPDEGHPWGHGKAEYLSAVLEGALIAVAAFSILRAALGRLIDPVPLDRLGLGTMLAVAASLANGALGLFLLRRARALESPALRADGLHVLSDILTTAGVLLGIGLARLTGWWVLDPLLAAAVALQILRVGWQLVRESLNALMDPTVPPEELEQLRAIVDRASGEPGRVHSLRARRAGRNLFVEVRLGLPPETRVCDAHDVCDAVEQALEAEYRGVEAFVHVEPAKS